MAVWLDGAFWRQPLTDVRSIVRKAGHVDVDGAGYRMSESVTVTGVRFEEWTFTVQEPWRNKQKHGYVWAAGEARHDRTGGVRRLSQLV